MAKKPQKRDVIGELYYSLLTDHELSHQLQWRIYEHAVRSKKPTLMARIAGHPNLDPKLDDKLSTHTEAKVMAAWIGRAGRPIDEIVDVLDKAKSVLVHEAAAGVTGLPKQLYRKLADDPNVDTARELLANPDVPLDVKRKAAVAYGRKQKKVRMTYHNRTAFESLFANQLGLLRDLASESSNPALIAAAVEKVSLPREDLLRIADEVLEPIFNGSVDGGEDYEFVTGVVNTAAGLLKQPNFPADRRLDLYRAGTSWVANKRNYHRNPLEQAFESIPNKGLPSTSHPNLEAVIGAETPEEIEAATKIALGANDSELATALASNPSAGAETVKKVVNLIPRNVRTQVAFTRARDIDVLATLIVHGDGYDLFSDDLVAASERPAEALLAIAREYRVAGKQVSARLGRSEYMTPSVMGALPLNVTAKRGTMLARRTVGDLLLEALDSSGDWEMFENLGNNFDGPLENLLLACGYVSTPAGAEPAEDDVTQDREPEPEPEPEQTPAEGVAPAQVVVDPDGIATYALF